VDKTYRALNTCVYWAVTALVRSMASALSESSHLTLLSSSAARRDKHEVRAGLDGQEATTLASCSFSKGWKSCGRWMCQWLKALVEVLGGRVRTG
jgi:hypothetical protein